MTQVSNSSGGFRSVLSFENSSCLWMALENQDDLDFHLFLDAADKELLAPEGYGNAKKRSPLAADGLAFLDGVKKLERELLAPLKI